MNLDEAEEVTREWLPAGRDGRAIFRVLIEYDRRGAVIERVREMCARAKPGRPTLEPSVFVSEILDAINGGQP